MYVYGHLYNTDYKGFMHLLPGMVQIISKCTCHKKGNDTKDNYRGLEKKGQWVVYLTGGSAGIAGINTVHYKMCKAVQIVCDIMG